MFPEFSFPTVTTGMMNRCRVLAFVFMIIGYGWEGAEEGKKRKTRQERLFCDAGPACMLLLAKLPLSFDQGSTPVIYGDSKFTATKLSAYVFSPSSNAGAKEIVQQESRGRWADTAGSRSLHGIRREIVQCLPIDVQYPCLEILQDHGQSQGHSYGNRQSPGDWW